MVKDILTLEGCSMKKYLFFLVLLFLTSSLHVCAESSLSAAFIRDHQLWIKKGEKEEQITTDKFVLSPKWSSDGRFIAYLDGDEKGEKSELFIYDTQTKINYQPYDQVSTFDFKWSPTTNQLAYVDRGILNVTKLEKGIPKGFQNVSLGVSSFEWFPNGKDLIVSAQSELIPTGWGPVPLFKVPVNAELNTELVKPFYTIQTNENDLFAINANYFKWSHDGKWLSLLAIPTASWSNDSNTLCVLSNEGKSFQSVGKMLGNGEWVKWAPSANQLAYISGEGRFLVENKKTTIADIPIFRQQKEYTPKGNVDLDLEWFSSDIVLVARAKENKEWKEGPVPTMFTALYAINLKSNEQKQMTYPDGLELDNSIQVVNSTITWLRRNEKANNQNIWIKEGLSGKEYIWIKNVDAAPAIYTTGLESLKQ